MATYGVSDVHYYDSTMSGAPSLTDVIGSLIGVIRACLIDGFGSEAAQGSWEVPFEDAARAAFRSLDTDSTRMYLYIDDSYIGTKTYARVNGYESMSGIDSGTNIFGTYLDAPLYWMKTNSAGSRPWAIIANNSAFYLLTRWYNIGDSALSYEGYFFGDVLSVLATSDPYCCGIIGSIASMVYPGGNGAGMNNFFTSANISTLGDTYYRGSTLARDYLGVVGQQKFTKSANSLTGAVYIGGDGAIDADYPDPVTGGLRVSLLSVVEQSSLDTNTEVFRGEMPGMYAPLHKLKPDDGTVAVAPDANNHTLRFFGLGFINQDYARVGIDISGPWECSVFGYANRGSLGISGTITENFFPGAYRVRLYRQSDGVLVRETWSANNGSYSFNGISDDIYFVICFDHTNPKQVPASMDNVVPS